ncbi:MAG: DUF6702 family protein [Verrucomicrobiota bacterium]|jgi:hypothetical protein
MSRPTSALAGLALALIAWAGTPHLEAHPFHTSLAEADYRTASGKLEIALRLFTDDAEAALSRRAGRAVKLTGQSALETDALLEASLRAGFSVKAADGSVQKLTWIGREITDGGQHLWIYFECALPGGAEGARFTNCLLRETFSDQINSLRVRDHRVTPARQVTLLFTGDAEQVATFGP